MKIPGLLKAFIFCITVLVLESYSADAYDSLYINTLNMTEEEAKAAYGVSLDSVKLNEAPTLQEQNEENPSYVKRDYNHKEQIIVGSVVMLCVAIAMVLMNNYNPTR